MSLNFFHRARKDLFWTMKRSKHRGHKEDRNGGISGEDRWQKISKEILADITNTCWLSAPFRTRGNILSHQYQWFSLFLSWKIQMHKLLHVPYFDLVVDLSHSSFYWPLLTNPIVMLHKILHILSTFKCMAIITCPWQLRGWISE